MEESVRVAELSDREVLRSLAAEARVELSNKRGGDVVERLDPHRADSRAEIVSAVDFGLVSVPVSSAVDDPDYEQAALRPDDVDVVPR